MAEEGATSEMLRYVPAVVLEHYQRTQESLSQPFLQEQFGSVLIVDISGFTKLTAKLTAEGASGLAAMSKYLNR
jgi:hypothetical protein